MALFGLACPLCIVLLLLLLASFVYNNAVFREIQNQHRMLAMESARASRAQVKEGFVTACPHQGRSPESQCQGDIDMSVPYGQTVSAVPLSKNCLLSMYVESCQHAKKLQPRVPEGSVYNYKPFDREAIANPQIYDLKSSATDRRLNRRADLKLPGFYPQRKSRCDRLNMRDCLATPSCGWLVNRGGELGRCVRGTPIGPANPRDIPDPEDAIRGNITLDMWKYSHPNPWAHQTGNIR